MNIEKVKENLERKGHQVSVFEKKSEAVDYILNSIKGKTIGFGGSQTITDLDLRKLLSENNTIYAPDFMHKDENFNATIQKAMSTDIFFLSANAMSENGEIVNIDGTGNRLAGSLFGHKKVYYIVGENKIGGTLDQALYRARNIASPKNALRFRCKTPCVMAVIEVLEKKFREKYAVNDSEEKIDQLQWQKFIEELDEKELNTHCYDCKSPDRICESLLIHWEKPHSMESEVVIIKEPMGF